MSRYNQRRELNDLWMAETCFQLKWISDQTAQGSPKHFWRQWALEERKKKERQDDFELKNCYPVWYGWLFFVVNLCVWCVRLCFFVLQPFWLLNWLDGCSSLRSLPPPSERKKMVSCSRDVRKEREKDLRQMIFLSVLSGARAFPGLYMIQDDWPWLTPSKGWCILILFGIAMCHYLPKKVTMWKILENIRKRFIPCY